MKNIGIKRVLMLSIIFFVHSYFFSISAVVFNFFCNAAEGFLIILSGLLFLVANWPSILLGVFPTIIDAAGKEVYAQGQGLVSPIAILANAVGWCIIGFIVGLVVSAVKGRRR